MAQSDRFYFWRGYYKAMRMLETNDQRGELLMAMCEYAFEGIEPHLTDRMQLMAWAVIEDQVRESVEIGRKQSERGSMGGRPRKAKKTTAKSAAKTTALSGAKSGVKSTAESGAESEGKRRDQKGTELPPSGDALCGVPSGEYEDIDFDNLPPMAHERA